MRCILSCRDAREAKQEREQLVTEARDEGGVAGVLKRIVSCVAVAGIEDKKECEERCGDARELPWHCRHMDILSIEVYSRGRRAW